MVAFSGGSWTCVCLCVCGLSWACQLYTFIPKRITDSSGNKQKECTDSAGHLSVTHFTINDACCF